MLRIDDSEIGLFGTLRLMKRTTNEQVAAFLIDEKVITFKRDTRCSVHLFHGGLFTVLGDVSLTIDGCHVLPSVNPSFPTISVSDNCVILSHKKHFICSYPPKQLCIPLYHIDAPLKPENRRKLIISLIHRAQVFIPRGKPSLKTSVSSGAQSSSSFWVPACALC
ncbi:hypothetical protein K503DRAFT_697568 [Rhizopogon vinicolor AM-OR11-026]|uniref:Uncharacterized protein n=1 Tax=Rhizopogon vinicolor AM-OR11-026 TaxID=1314800 RepID=A0A1B7MR59_9AGAM|nr:hypothetical protein K503DRAFT_697568 [Rhizopogon vinicolor AM-OR11-026]